MGKVQKEYASIACKRTPDGIEFKVKLSPELIAAAKKWSGGIKSNCFTAVNGGQIQCWRVNYQSRVMTSTFDDDEAMSNMLFPVMPEGQNEISFILPFPRTSEQCKNFIQWATEEYRRIYLQHLRPFSVTGTMVVEEDEPVRATVQSSNR